MSITEVEDLTMFCRVCLQIPEDQDILDLNLIYDEEEQLSYYECFTMCTQINLTDDDGLPQNLCRRCCLELQMAYDFYKKVEESKRFLAQLQDQHAEAAVATADSVSATTQECDPEDEEEVEEHLELEDYQAVEQLDDEELDYKSEIYIKEEDEQEGEVEELVEDGESIYKEFVIDNVAEEVNEKYEEQNVELKQEVVEKLSDSENEADDEEVNFDVLYEKVFEDVKTEQPDSDKPIEKIMETLTTKRRRGRPRQKPADDDDDPDFLLDELQKYERREQKQKEQAENMKASSVDTESDSAQTQPAVKRKRGAPSKYTNDGPPFECEICHTTCKSRALLNSHRFRKHRPPEDPQFPCTKCDRFFVSKQALQRHMRRPTCDAYPQFDCEHCGKKCIGLSNYNIHLRFHKRQYPFVCHLCGKKFMMCVHLNEHVLVKHENKRYPCEYPGCGKLFQTRNSLYNHSYRHAGVMPYECTYCKRGYASKSRLRFHCKKSHGIDHSIDELDSMQVTEKLPKTVVKPQ